MIILGSLKTKSQKMCNYSKYVMLKYQTIGWKSKKIHVVIFAIIVILFYIFLFPYMYLLFTYIHFKAVVYVPTATKYYHITFTFF